MDITTTFYARSAAEWRGWLRKHHAGEREIWLVFYRKASGKPRVSYNDAVDHALCYGWIDSIVKKVDHERFAQRFTPRRRGSALSELNKARVRRLIREKLMTRAGLAALEGALRGGTVIHRGRVRETRRFTVPRDILAAIRKDPEAWKHFGRLPLTYKRIRIAFIDGARRVPEVFRKRLAYFVRMTAKQKRFGMVQR
jgi:uncharacterized protein YdeI (YjbR/CyaY-like superfamily)